MAANRLPQLLEFNKIKKWSLRTSLCCVRRFACTDWNKPLLAN